jgi:hypothetical protein
MGRRQALRGIGQRGMGQQRLCGEIVPQPPGEARVCCGKLCEASGVYQQHSAALCRKP